MPSSRRSRFRHAEVRSARGFDRIRTVRTRSGKELRIGFRSDGSSALVSVLTPKGRRERGIRQPYYGSDARQGSMRFDSKHGAYTVENATVRLESHAHRDPSHHVGPCGPACRAGDAVHAHTVGRITLKRRR